MEKYTAAVLGCTGVVGQRFIAMLAGHPFFEIGALAASPGAAGRPYGETADWTLSRPCPRAALRMRLCKPTAGELKKRGVDLVLSGLPAIEAGGIERELAGAGLRVFTNAGANRTRPDVPVVVPEVNPDFLDLLEGPRTAGSGWIVANANCSTTGLVLALKPLLGLGIRGLQVTTSQAVSGAGRRGLAALGILDNVIPFISGEEEKMERETNRILGRMENGGVRPAGIDITATCCRVPVRDGHLQAVTAELERPAELEEVRAVFRAFRGLPQRMRLPSAPRRPLLLREEPDRPQPALDALAGDPTRAAGMAVSLGRLQCRGRRLRFVLLVHNTIRGAAGTSLLNAELCATLGLMKSAPVNRGLGDKPCGS